MKNHLLTKIFCGLYFIFCLIHIQAQSDTLYYINSSFETPEDQAKWASTPTHPNIKWTYENGGDNFPINAFSGDNNALFYWSDVVTGYYRNLISLPIDLSGAVKPELTFWHAQAKSVFGQDELLILFKAGSSAPWDTITRYTDRLDNWTKHVFNIDEVDPKYLCENFQIGFLGYANSGHGVCIDSVVLKETEIIDKYIKSIVYQPVNHQVVGSGVKQIPLIKVEVVINGNDGVSDLKSISFRLNSGDPSLFNSNGFRLYHTIGGIFKNRESGSSTQIGTAISVSGNVVTFTGLNHELGLGSNYLWLTADIAPGAPNGSQFSFGVVANSFSYKDTLLPTVAYPSIVSPTISEAIFYDNFDALTGWNLEGDFEIAVPQGKVIDKSKDPSYAYSNTKVLGTDLTNDGAYVDTIYGPNAYHATSPQINLKYYNEVKVYMRKWIDFNPVDRASIDISNNGGKNWITIWQNQLDNPAASSTWEELLFNSVADQYLSRQDSVRIRFSVNETNSIYTRAGFNIDNFTITGNHLTKDVGITSIITPYDDCIGFGNDTVKVVVKNYAEYATPVQIPIYYGLWGPNNTLVHDTIMASIPKDDSITFSFSTPAYFPQGDIYDQFIVGLALPGDEDASNDTMTKVLRIQDTYVPPVSLNFEYKGAIWSPSEGSSWTCKIPDGSIPVIPTSPNSWIQSPYGEYINNDLSYVTSNCFDLTHENRYIIQLDYWLVSEAGKDGAAVEYSTDDGNTWHLVDVTSFGNTRGWYNSSVAALGHIGWSGLLNEWKTARELLPELLNTEVKVKFRIKWASDGENSGRGFAMDNLKIYPAAADVGVSYIVTPENSCQYSYDDNVSLYIKNYGYNRLKQNDTMVVGYKFENQPAVLDTFYLSAELQPGDSILHTMPSTFNIDMPGTYDILAYTLIEDDPWFYGSNNDTAWKSFETWVNPTTGLIDTIQSREVDTVIIRPIIDPQYTYLWGDNSTNNYFDVTVPGHVYVTVTDITHGCQIEDSVYIELLFNDVGIDSIIWPVSSCELGISEQVQLQIHNFGTDSLIIGDKIVLYYEINGSSLIADSITLNSPLYSNHNLWFTFEERTENFSAVGNYSITAYTDYGGDTVTYNDTINRTITVFGYPDLYLGNDTVINGVEYTLDVDPAFTSYLWNDGITEGTRVIDTSGLYWLNVLDVNGCPASDTIDIWFRVRDIKPYLLLSPLSECNRTGQDPVTLRVENSGSDTLTNLSTINVSYKVNSGARVTESFTISQLRPGQRTDHTFTPLVDISALGSYNFSITATTTGDMRPGNDTITKVLVSNTNPEVDLGIDTEETYYVTQMVLDAGAGADWVYLWQDGSTNRTYTATNSGTIRVLVTDTVTGCYGGDTAFISMDILDYMITSVSLRASECIGDYSEMEILLLNNGNLSRQGAEITLDFLLGTQLLFTDIFSYSGIWMAGTLKTYTTDNTISLQTPGSQQLHVNISATGDLRPENDDFTRNINVLPSPVVDFGGENLDVTLPFTLNAGSGHADYLWSDGSDGSTLLVTQPGTYSVTVTGTNSCQTVQSVDINITSISDLAKESMVVNIYPNPANNYVTVEAAFDIPDTYTIEIFNAQNMRFYSHDITTMEYEETLYTGDLPPGLYFIRIRSNEMYYISKLVIQ
jgi:hypothetical protein